MFGKSKKIILFAAVVVILYWYPITLLKHVIPTFDVSVATMAKYVVLLFLLILSVFRGNWWSPLPLNIFIAAAFASSALSMSQKSIFQWGAFSLLVFSVGPGIISSFASNLRKNLWWLMLLTSVLVVIASFFLKIVGVEMPLIYSGTGYSGVTTHAMILGPISGVVAIYAISKLKGFKDILNMSLMVVSVAMCYASMSRIAIISLYASLGIILLYRTISSLSIHILIGLTCVLVAVILSLLIIEPNFFENSTLIDLFGAKGTQNTRDELWRMRLLEFSSSPMFGVGVGLGESQEKFVREENLSESSSDKLEPGSNYLSLLSMTGIVGAVAFFSFIYYFILTVRKTWRFYSLEDKQVVLGIGTFFLLHGIAEGWLFGPGNIMALFFWLYIGRYIDCLKSDSTLVTS